jgi:hypothetical protein
LHALFSDGVFKMSGDFQIIFGEIIGQRLE